MKNEEFLRRYTKPIGDFFSNGGASFDDDRLNVLNEIEYFLTENKDLPNEEFRKKTVDKYKESVELIRPIVDSKRLSKIKGYLEFFIIITAVSFLIWIITMIIAASATPPSHYPY